MALRFWKSKKTEAQESLEQLRAGGSAQPAAERSRASSPSSPGDPTTIFSMTAQDAFEIRGRGTVVTGTVEQGSVRRGMSVGISTPGRAVVEAIVQGVEVIGTLTEAAETGEDVGLLFTDLRPEDVPVGSLVASRA